MKISTHIALTAVTVAVTTAVGATAGWATPINVPTYSFESPVPTVNSGTKQAETPNNWTDTHQNAQSAGITIYNIVNTGPNAVTGPITSGVTGDQYIYSSVLLPTANGPVPPAGLLNTLANTASVGTFAADTTYTLTVSMTTSKSKMIFPGIGLSDAALTLATITADNSVLYTGYTDFTSSAALQDMTFTLDTSASANTSLVGQPIFISLLVKSTTTGTSAAEFDNVRLDATANTPIPEPASLTLLGMGGLTLLARHRKNKLV